MLALQATVQRSQILYKVVNLDMLNKWSLGDFDKMEGTQMEVFNFLWLIWDHYLPLTPT